MKFNKQPYGSSGIDWNDPAAVKEYKKTWLRAHYMPHPRQAKPKAPPTKPESGTPKAVRVNCIVYPTLADAARALGISKQRMSQIVKRDGYDIKR